MHHFNVHRQRNSFLISLVLLLLTFFAASANARTAPLKAASVPVISSVQVPASGSYKKNDKLTFTVTFNSVVRITAVSRIALTINGQTHYAVNESAADAAVQKFSYVISNGDDLSNGTIYFDNKLEIASGLIRDVASGDYLDQGFVPLPAGTPASAANMNVDGTPPVPDVFRLTGPKDVAVSVPSLSFTIRFSEKVTNVTKAGWVATGTTKVTYSDYNVVMNPDQQTGLITFLNVTNLDHRDSGMLGVTLLPGPSGIKDLAGNPLEVSGVSDSYYMEKATLTAPVPTIAVVGGKTRVNGPFTVNVVFDKTVLPATFDPSKLAVTNATAVFTGNPSVGVYKYEITPAATPASGAISVQLLAGSIKGETNLDNLASNELIVSYDLIRPTVLSIAPSANSALQQFEAVVTFSEPVSGLSPTGLLGTNGTVSITELAPNNGTVYKISFVPVGPTAEINLSVMENAAFDEYGNGNIGRSAPPFLYDVEAPKPIALAPLTTSPTNLNTGAFLLTFSEEVTAPAPTDFATYVTGTVNSATVSNIVRLSPSSFRLELNGITGDGNLSLALLSTADVRDNAGNKISMGISSTAITYDHTPPVLTLPAGGGAYGAPFTITYTFNEAVVPGDPAAFSFTNASQGALAKVDDQHYTALVTPGATGNFSVTVNPAAFYDKAGNPLSAAATFTAVFNNEVPQPELTKVDGYTSPFTINIHFSTPIYGAISAASFVTTNVQGITLTQLSNQDYQLKVNPATPGVVSVYLKGNIVQSITGIPNAVSNTVTWTYDPAPFNIVLSGPSVALNSFDVDVVGSKAMDPVTAGIFTVSNGTVTGVQKLSDTHYKLTIAPAASGSVTVQLPAGQLSDAVGRPNSASNVLTVMATINSAPTDITLTPSAVDENAPAGTVVGVLGATDPDAGNTFTFEITGGPDMGSFEINTAGQLLTKAVFDYETKNQYRITVKVTDNNGATFSRDLVINVNNVNEAPTDILLNNTSIDENKPTGTPVANVTGADPDNDVLSFSLVNTLDAASFTLGTDNILRTAAVFDYESKQTYTIRIRAQDAHGLYIEKDFTIHVQNVNESPADISLDNNTVDENKPAGTLVGTFTVQDPDNFTFVLQLVPGADASLFTIDGYQLKTAAAFDYETKNTYTIRVRAVDGEGLDVEKDFTIHVKNVNEAPSDLSLSNNTIGENAAVNTVVGTLSTTDVDGGDTFTYTLAAGGDNDAFQVTGNQLVTKQTFDRTVKSTYTISVTTTDAGGLSFTKQLTIQVVHVPLAPTDVALSANSIEENKPVNTLIGAFSATDANANETFTYTLLPGLDADSFLIVNDKLYNKVVFDYEKGHTYSIKVQVKDADGLTNEKVFTITVTNVNEAPVDVALSNNKVAENEAVGTTVGALSGADPDAGDVLTFSFGGGADDAAFDINGTTLVTKAVFDYETKQQYHIKIKVTDAAGLSYTKDFVIQVTNVNEAPVDFSLDNTSIAEMKPVGTVVGNLTATDPDANDSFTWTITGGADQAKFSISGNQVLVNAQLDYTQQQNYTIRVRVTDAGGLWIEKEVTITVTAVNAAPTNISLDKNTILENAPAGTVIGTLSATDPDAGDVLTFAFAGGADDAKFRINAANQLVSDAVFDYEQKNSYIVRVRVTDKRGLTLEKDLTVSVVDVNEAPTIDAVTKQIVCDGHQAQEIRITGLSAGPEKGQAITIVATSSQDFFTGLTTRDNKDGTGAVRFTLKDKTKGSTTITVLVRDDGGVANGGVDQVAITFELLVNELPDVQVVSDKPNPVPAGSVVKLTASGGVSYEWGDGAYIIDGRNTPVLTLKPEATSVYLVTVTNANGCTVTTDYKVEVRGEVQVEAANLLTPNGDGINDRWVVKNIGRYLNNEVKIFDRAGRMVYTRKGYNNEWDGKVNGQRLAEGTYYYILDLGNGSRLKGFITIIHEH